MKKNLFTLLLFFPLASLAQNSEVFKIDSLPRQGILLDSGWKFHSGDNTIWAMPNIDDSKWENINPAKNIYDLPQVRNANICWLRLNLQLDSSLVGKPLALVIVQIGASEIYLNGRLIKRFGQVSSDPEKLQTFNPHGKPLSLQFTSGLQQVFAIRYAIDKSAPYFKADPTICFSVNLQQPDQAVENYATSTFIFLSSWYFQFGIYLLLSVIHLFFFIYYPIKKVNLYFAIYIFAFSITYLWGGVYTFIHEMTQVFIGQVVFIIAAAISSIFLIIAVYKLFNRSTDIFFKSIIILCVLATLVMFLPYEWSSYSLGFAFFISGLGTMRVCILAMRRKQPGAIVVLVGQLISLLFFITDTVAVYESTSFSNSNLSLLIISVAFLCPPIFISILLAKEFAQTNISLHKQLEQVEKLSLKTIVQEKEKQQILAEQNEMLERKVTERTTALNNSLQELKSTQAQLIQSEKMASLGELTAGIAHEIQNPLNFVNNFSEVNKEMLEELKAERLKPKAERDEKTEAEIIEDVIANEEKINHHGKRADAIVKGMLQHSRKSEGTKEPTDINALCDEYLRLSYHGLRAKDKSFNATLNTAYDETIGNNNIIPQDIGRVLLNLFNNAFYATNQKQKDMKGQQPYVPTVTIVTKKLNDKIEIYVSDNGNGIPQKILDKIFQPFFTTKPTGQGTGLGLSLSYEIIKAHGGEIKVESKEGEGSEFIIQLPIV